MPWQIQVRHKRDGREWEPISVERCRVVSGGFLVHGGHHHERQYHYETLDEVKLAFAEFVEIEGGLPNLIVRQATGRPKFTDKYDVRFVWISQPGIVWCKETTPEPEALAETERAIPQAEVREGIAACLRACAKSITENRMEGPAAANYLDAYAAVVLKEGPPAHFTAETGSTQDPPTPETRTSGSDTYGGAFDPVKPDYEEAIRAINRLPRIGVYDYDSLVACLRTNYKLVFGDDAPLTDPQDMIQRLAAEVQNLRRAFPNDPEV